jgi:hypothetical protein
MPNLPWTRHAVWYAYDIRVNGRIVGSLQNVGSEFKQDLERIRELFENTGTRVREMVPGKTDISLRVELIQLYRTPLFRALGYEVYSLEQFKHKFDVVEREHWPDGTVIQRVYHDCMIASYGRTIATATAHVAERADLEVGWVSGGKSPLGDITGVFG